jgi:hypothetical protein
MKELPLNYRITAKDAERGHKIIARYFVPLGEPEPTEDEVRLAELLLDGEELHRHTGKWPTVGEVLTHWKQEAQDRKR